MVNLIARSLTVALLGLAVVSCAAAAPTGLNLIPTADLLSQREIALEYQMDGARLFDSDCNQWALLQFGLSNRFEIGVDRCFDGETDTFANAKILLRAGDKGSAIAFGVQNVASGSQAQPYLALAQDLAGARWHLGAIRIDGETAALAGVERGLTDKLTFVADHVTGSESASGVGVSADLPYGLSLSVSRIFSHATDGEDSWQLIFSGAPVIRF